MILDVRGLWIWLCGWLWVRVEWILALDGDAAAFGFGMRYGGGWLSMGFKEDAGFGYGCVRFGFGVCRMWHTFKILTSDARCGYDVRCPGLWMWECGVATGVALQSLATWDLVCFAVA